MWNHFVTKKDGIDFPSKYFSRTLEETGPMGILSANSDWRPFQLPFFIGGADVTGPNKITFNLHLEGEGLVEIRNITLTDAVHANVSTSYAVLPMLIAFFLLLIPVLAITIYVFRRRKKRIAAELQRIRAADA